MRTPKHAKARKSSPGAVPRARAKTHLPAFIPQVNCLTSAGDYPTAFQTGAPPSTACHADTDIVGKACCKPYRDAPAAGGQRLARRN